MVVSYKVLREQTAKKLAGLQAVVDAAKALTESVDCYDNYGDLTEPNDRLKQAIKEVCNAQAETPQD